MSLTFSGRASPVPTNVTRRDRLADDAIPVGLMRAGVGRAGKTGEPLTAQEAAREDAALFPDCMPRALPVAIPPSHSPLRFRNPSVTPSAASEPLEASTRLEIPWGVFGKLP